MEGIANVTARVTELQARLSSMQAPAVGGSFASMLQTRLSGQAAAGTATAGTTATTATGATSATSATSAAYEPRPAWAAGAAKAAAGSRVTVPAELKAYGNGKIPKSALSEIGVGSHRMYAPAAEGFKAMSAAAKAAGVSLGVTDSYRSYEAQVDVARRKGLHSQGGLAAKPGTSNHGWGLSLDLKLNDEALAWMRANGGRYGFVEDVSREPWHWTFHG